MNELYTFPIYGNFKTYVARIQFITAAITKSLFLEDIRFNFGGSNFKFLHTIQLGHESFYTENFR